MKRPALLFLGSLVLTSSMLRADESQTLQIAPFYGFRTGQNFDNQVTGRKVDLDASASYGATIDIPLIKYGQYLELLYSRQEGELSGGGLSPKIDINIDEWQAGVLQEYNYDKMRPFLVGTLGVTHFDVADGYGTKDLFSVGLGGGVKYFPRPHIGLRLDARGYVSFIEGSGAIACSGGCVATYSGDIFWQLEIAPSVVIAF